MILVAKLHKMMGGAIERIVPETDPNRPDGIINKRYTFLPGEEYEIDDPKTIQYFKGEIYDIRERQVLSANLKAELEANHIPYETQKCGTCASAATKALFNPFVVKEVEQ